MGTADVVPGVSGGTVALITGIYDELVKTVSKIDHHALKMAMRFEWKQLFNHLNLKFLIPLFSGIVLALIIMSKVMHFLMDQFPIYTWALFLGLILSSIVILLKNLKSSYNPQNFFSLIIGTLIGYLVVTMIPVSTPNNFVLVFFSGMIGICAMILPGISGSFILLILGKYYFVTSLLKDPFSGNNLIFILVFCTGCLLGLISFSKVLNYLLAKFHDLTLFLLIGFMIGSLKKIWPWKRISDSISLENIEKKKNLLADELYLPNELNSEVIFALIFMVSAFLIVFLLEVYSKSSKRGVSSAG